MATKTYNPVQSDHKFIDIIEFLHQQTAPVSAAAISRALNIPHATIMSHMIVALERKWARMNGEAYESGSRISGMYAVYLQGLKDRRSDISGEIEQLEVCEVSNHSLATRLLAC
jgi:DNA-binding IclR family transcriptional regulator